MARIVDITDKLNFEERPKLVVEGVEIEVNNKAVDLLKIAPHLQKGKASVEDIYKMFQVIFSEEDQKKIERFNLDFEDFSTLIFAAADLMVPPDDDEGETQTPATT